MMNFNSEDQKSRLLYSDSLQGNLPDEFLDEVFESSISAAIVTEKQENSAMGILVGVEFAENPKVDIKISIENAFSFMSNVLSEEKNRTAKQIIFALGERAVNFSGPYTIRSTKIVEIDIANKSCVLAVDLIKGKD